MLKDVLQLDPLGCHSSVVVGAAVDLQFNGTIYNTKYNMQMLIYSGDHRAHYEPIPSKYQLFEMMHGVALQGEDFMEIQGSASPV